MGSDIRIGSHYFILTQSVPPVVTSGWWASRLPRGTPKGAEGGGSDNPALASLMPG